MNITAVRRVGRVAPPLNAAPNGSGLVSDLANILNDGVAIATISVYILDLDVLPVVGATIVPSATGSGNTLSTPAVTNAGGLSSFTFKTTGAGGHDISITANGIAVTAIVTVTASGASTIDRTTSTVTLASASAVEGEAAVTVTLQGKDAASANMTAGGSTIVFASSNTNFATVGATTDLATGQYTALVTPVAAGSAVISATIAGLAVTDTDTLTVTAAGGFAAADIHIVSLLAGSGHYANGWGDLFSTAAAPPAGDKSTVLRVTNGPTPYPDGGTHVIERAIPTVPGTDDNPSISSWFGRPSVGYWVIPSTVANTNGAVGLDRVYCRFYFNFNCVIDSIMKFAILESYQPIQQFGGFYIIGGQLRCLIYPEWAGYTGNLPVLETMTNLINGWHSVEYELWRFGHASGQPAVRMWLDGTIKSGMSLGSTAAYGASWSGDYLLAGPRITTGGFDTAQPGLLKLAGNLNPGETVTGKVWLDRIAVSTARIGP